MNFFNTFILTVVFILVAQLSSAQAQINWGSLEELESLKGPVVTESSILIDKALVQKYCDRISKDKDIRWFIYSANMQKYASGKWSCTSGYHKRIPVQPFQVCDRLNLGKPYHFLDRPLSKDNQTWYCSKTPVLTKSRILAIELSNKTPKSCKHFDPFDPRFIYSVAVVSLNRLIAEAQSFLDSENTDENKKNELSLAISKIISRKRLPFRSGLYGRDNHIPRAQSSAYKPDLNLKLFLKHIDENMYLFEHTVQGMCDEAGMFQAQVAIEPCSDDQRLGWNEYSPQNIYTGILLVDELRAQFALAHHKFCMFYKSRDPDFENNYPSYATQEDDINKLILELNDLKQSAKEILDELQN